MLENAPPAKEPFTVAPRIAIAGIFLTIARLETAEAASMVLSFNACGACSSTLCTVRWSVMSEELEDRSSATPCAARKVVPNPVPSRIPFAPPVARAVPTVTVVAATFSVMRKPVSILWEVSMTFSRSRLNCLSSAERMRSLSEIALRTSGILAISVFLS